MRTSLADHAKGYCDNTTVHGFAYLTEGRDWAEKVFWAIVIVCGLSIASVIIHRGLRQGNQWPQTWTQGGLGHVSLPSTRKFYPSGRLSGQKYPPLPTPLPLWPRPYLINKLAVIAKFPAASGGL